MDATQFDLQGALKSGYSPGEIANYLGQQEGFDVTGAKKAGYTDDEIIGHLLPKPPETVPSDYLKSLASGALTGTGMIAQGGGELLARGVNKLAEEAGYNPELRAVNPLQGAVDWLEESKSPGAKELEQGSQITGSVMHPSTWAWGSNPSIRGIALQGMNAIGQIAPNLGLAMATAGLSAPAQALVGGVVGGVQALGGSLDQEREAIQAMSPQDLQASSELYRTLIAKGVDPVTAKNTVVESSAIGGGLGNAIPSAGEWAFETFLIRLLTSGKLPIPATIGTGAVGKAITGTIGGAALGGVEEAVEQAGQNVGSNLAIGGNRPIGEDTLQQFVMGAIGQGVPGAGFGAVSHLMEKVNPPITAPLTGPLQQQDAQAQAANQKIAAIDQAPNVDAAIAQAQDAVDTVSITASVQTSAKFAMEGRQLLEAMERQQQEEAAYGQRAENLHTLDAEKAAIQEDERTRIWSDRLAQMVANGQGNGPIANALREKLNLQEQKNAIPEQSAGALDVRNAPSNGEAVGEGYAQPAVSPAVQAPALEVARAHLQGNEVTPPAASPAATVPNPGTTVPNLGTPTVFGQPLNILTDQALRTVANKGATPEIRQAASTELDHRQASIFSAAEPAVQAALEPFGVVAKQTLVGEPAPMQPTATPEGLQRLREQTHSEAYNRRNAPAPEAFTLTGSTRAADEAAARGQQELAPVQETPAFTQHAQPATAERPFAQTPLKELQRIARQSEGEQLTAAENELNLRAEERAQQREERLANGRAAKVAKPLNAPQPFAAPKPTETPGLKEAVDAAEAAVRGKVLYSRTAPAPVFYSELSKQIGNASMQAAPAKAWQDYLRGLVNKGVKPDEIEWTGIKDWLELQQGKVTKEAVQDYLKQNGVRVEETTLGEVKKPRPPKTLSVYQQAKTAKFASYQLPGGENYRELLLTLPAPYGESEQQVMKSLREKYGLHSADWFYNHRNELSEADNARLDSVTSSVTAKEKLAFKSSHFDEPNILAHVRFNERTDAEGKKVLFIEEIQSDWAQKGKREGFAQRAPEEERKAKEEAARDIVRRRQTLEAAGNYAESAALDREYTHLMNEGAKAAGYGIPSAPFVGKTEAWVALALKRMIRYAAENGFDRVAWTTGEQQAGRYDLSKRVDFIDYKKESENLYRVSVHTPESGGRFVIHEMLYGPAMLPDVVGKDIADKIVRGEGTQQKGWTQLSGLDLKVGGEGMRAFYDKIVPNVANDVLKKLGGERVSDVVMGGRATTQEGIGGQVQPGFDITPALREKALGGLPLFSETGRRKADYLYNVVDKTGKTLAEGLPYEQAKFQNLTRFGEEGTLQPVGRQTAAQVEKVIAAPLSRLKNIPEVQVVQEAMNIPGLSEAHISSEGGDIEGAYVDGKLYLVASGLKSAARAREVLAHEAIGHLSVEQMLEQAKPGLMREFTKQVQTLDKAANPYIRNLASTVDERQPGLEAADRAKEIIALVAERGDQGKEMGPAVRSLWRRIVDAIQAFYKLAFGKSINDQDVRDIVGLAERWARGENHVTEVINGVMQTRALMSREKDQTPDALFSLAPKVSLESARGVFDDITKSDRVLNRVISKFNTPFHISETQPAFKPVYDEAQAANQTTSAVANAAADQAPDLLPRIDSLADFKKKAPSKEDMNAVADAVYAGTLFGGGSPMEGRIWTDEELKTARAIDKNGVSMPANFAPLNDQQAKLYRQNLAAVAQSLTEHSKALIWRLADQQGLGVERSYNLPDVAEQARHQADVRISELQAELATRDNYREDMMKEGEEAQTAKAAQEDADRTQKQIDELTALKESVSDIEAKTQGLIEHGYSPIMRFGKYGVNVQEVDAQGNKKELFFGRYETQMAANMAARKLQAEFPNGQVRTGVMPDESYKLFQGLNLDALQMFAEHMTDDEGKPISSDPVMQEFFRVATTERSALKRQLHRKGTPGFSKDVARALAQFTVSMATATARTYHGATMLSKVRDIKQGDLQNYAARYVRYLQDPQEESHGLRGFLANYYILGSLAFGAVNMTQPVLITGPYLTQYTSYGKAMAHLGSAAFDMVRGRKNLSPDETKAYQKAIAEGIVAPQEIHQIRADSQASAFGDSPLWQKLDSVLEEKGVKLPGKMALRKAAFLWGSIYSLTEQFNRGSTFLAAYRIAQEQDISNPYEMAKEAVAATQFTYNRANRMEASRGPIGSVIMTFKSFNVSYLELAKRLYTNDKKAFSVLMLTLFALAGAQGMPFAEDVEDLIDTIGQWLGYSTNSKKKVRELAVGLVGKDISNFLLYGTSAIPGVPIDIANRMGMHNIIPGTAMLKTSEPDKTRDILELLGPAATLFQNAGKAIQGAATGQPGNLKLLLPASIQNAAKAEQMLSTGEYRDQGGRKVMDVDAMDAMFKGIGFQPSKLAAESRIVSQNQQDITLQKTVEASIADNWAQGIVNHDPASIEKAREQLKDWNEKNKDMPIAINNGQITRRIRELKMSRQERFVKSASPEVRNAVRQDLRQ